MASPPTLNFNRTGGVATAADGVVVAMVAGAVGVMDGAAGEAGVVMAAMAVAGEATEDMEVGAAGAGESSAGSAFCLTDTSDLVKFVEMGEDRCNQLTFANTIDNVKTDKFKQPLFSFHFLQRFFISKGTGVSRSHHFLAAQACL